MLDRGDRTMTTVVLVSTCLFWVDMQFGQEVIVYNGYHWFKKNMTRVVGWVKYVQDNNIKKRESGFEVDNGHLEGKQ